MNRSLMFIGCLIALALVSSTAGAQTFDLVVEGVPPRIAGGSETSVAFDAQCVLVPGGLTEEDDGAQGWSVSVSADGAEITGATTAGTVVDELFSGGFQKTQLTDNTEEGGEGDCVGRKGAVSAVVLSFTEPVTLSAVGASPILSLSVEAVTPVLGPEAEDEICALARIYFVDACQGDGQPVANKVTFEGATFTPTLGEAVVELCSAPRPPCCLDAPLGLIWQKASVGEVPDLFAGSLGAGEGCDDADPVLELSAAEGEVGSGKAYVAIVSQLPGTGVQGWSLSIAADDLNVVDTTTVGTATEALFSGGFQKTQVIDPDVNDGQQGAVSAIVLSFTEPVTLAPVGTATVLEVSVESICTSPCDGGKLRFQDGLRGAGQPVSVAATVDGATANFCKPLDLLLPVVAPAVAAFRTSDANGDAKIDIADPIFVINNLFRDGPDFPCPAAVDANDDGMIDLSDATYVIAYLFLAGPAPIGDLECHIDPDVPPEDCPAGSTACP